MIRAVVPHPALSAMLVVVWLLLENRITPGGIALGVVFGLVLPIFTHPFWPNRPRIRFGRSLAAYACVVLVDIVVANFQVAWIILFRRNASLRSRWLVIPVSLSSAEAMTVLAATISLTPGTVSADISADGRYLLVHALDVADAADEIARIKDRYEARLQRIFA